MTRKYAPILALVVIAVGQAQQQTSKTAEQPHAGQSPRVTRYSPYAAAGGYSRERLSFWEFWLHRFNPTNVNYGALIEERRRRFLQQAGANPYFWFAFAEFASLCFLLLWLAKERMDRKDTEWEAAGCMADLANYAEYCKRNAQEAITKYNDHIETCNRVIESADTGRPIPAGSQEDWRPEMDRLRTELAEQVSENARLAAELAQKSQMVTAMSTRIDDLARQLNGRSNSAPNTDLVDRVNRLTAELDAERARNRRGKGA
jgi:hypothetical protein